MGTERLKEQYNLLLNEQKNKMDKLKQKRLMNNNQEKTKYDSISSNIYDDNEYELDLKDDLDNDMFLKLNDQHDSSDDEKPKLSKSNKLLLKKTNKKQEKFQTSSPDGMETIRESLSFADKLRELQDENGRLRKVLAEKDYEMNQLKKKLSEERDALGSLENNVEGVAAMKIVDLAKKVRELTAQYEAEKTRNKQLTKNFAELENRFQHLKDKKSKGSDDTLEVDEVDDENEESNEPKKISLNKENKELKEKLNQTSHKMMEYKSQCEILKQDLKRTQKALEKEVGENVDIKSILTGHSNWKGRQQQIRMLQSKVADLKQQVGMMDARASQMFLEDEEFDESNFLKDGSKSAQISTISGFTSNTASMRSNIDSRNRTDLRRLEKDKKEKLEKMKREHEILESESNSLKEKLEATKARNTVLTNENKTYKEQVKTLLEKGKHDDELIEALMKKQSQLKEVLENVTYQNETITKEIEEKTKEGQMKNMQEKNLIDQLKSIIAEKEKKIKQQEREIEELKESSANRTIMTSTEQFFLNNNNNNETKILQNEIETRPSSSANQKSQSSLNKAKSDLDRDIVSRNSVRSAKTNQRPSSSSGSGSGGVGSLNAKLIEQRKEKSTDYKVENSELRTLYNASEIERVRLMELVKTLQKRIEEMNEKSIDNENKLNEQRRRCATLEKQNERLKLSESKSNSGSNSNNSNKQKSTTSTIDQYKLEELETSLLIQKDENDALKAALKSTLEAKEEDLRLYVEMLESTKRVFLDGLKQVKNSKSE